MDCGPENCDANIINGFTTLMSGLTNMKLALPALLLVAGGIVAQSRDREVAIEYAPVFYQALGDKPRGDYITNFDFDGDWRGDNNWVNADKKRFPLKAYAYYSVSETKTHYFIHYAVYHPRDYKGGEIRGRILSGLLRQGAEIAGKQDPTGLLDEATLAHENDMEGALVVVEKASRQVTYVQTVAHNRFMGYTADDVKFEGSRVQLYIEAKGHGIEAYVPEKHGERNSIIYRFTGVAGDPEKDQTSYDLLPIATTIWPKARISGAKGPTYGATHKYGTITIGVLNAKGIAVDRKVTLGNLGSAFLGRQGGLNRARPPWGWFDSTRREEPLGLWFFDPARTVKRDLKLGDDFPVAYLHPPFWVK
jgi:hypothetical protein